MTKKRIGKVTTVNIETGRVVSEKRNAMALLPAGDVCQVCATDHAHFQPHNQQSLYYQMAFHASHGRWPTWTDAMAHCDDATKQYWRAELVRLMRENGTEIPPDLLDDSTKGARS